MAFGNNLKGEQTRASFQTAGGCIMKFKHPYLAGAIANGSTNANIDEIDVSRSVKLADTFFSATPNQDSSAQVVMVDGSTTTITNHLLNGTITIPAIQTTGLVGSGDFVAACQLVKASKDSVGGTFTVTEFIDGKAITTLYYGVSIKNLPDKIKMGLDVPVYQIQLLYAGWIQAVSESASLNKRAIWASGNANGIEGFFEPYGVNQASTGEDAMSSTNVVNHSDIPTAKDLYAADNSSAATAAIGANGTVGDGKVLDNA